jgi:hypothetical protein
MSAREIGNAALHVAGGGLIAGSILWIGWLAIPAMLAVGVLREQAQHRDEGAWAFLTAHRMFEASMWAVGGGLAALGFALL